MTTVPAVRCRRLNQVSVHPDRDYVLYWMIASRRIHSNFSLQRAVEWSRELGKPLIIFEALRVGYRWASDRIHRFVMQGMSDNRESLARSSATYYAYVEPKPDAARGLLHALAEKACIVVTDEFPCFFIPRMLSVVSQRLPACLEAVDSNGLLPMAATHRAYTTAYSFRRFLQKELPRHLSERPEQDPLLRLEVPRIPVPPQILEFWPAATDRLLQANPDVLRSIPIDHDVRPARCDGGANAATNHLQSFVDGNLDRYGEARNHPDDPVSSGLSPYLHFGHISVHAVFESIASREGWSEEDLSDVTNGSRSGWWGMSDSAESYLDELITWRELGYNMCFQRSDYDRYESLPDWALETLGKHASDQREVIYSLDEFETAATHDDIWNAAQTELVRDGRMHNYLRMLWGKKILEWTDSPREALRVMIHLNNKYAVDGRDPNSYSGIFWVLGRYDRAWGPERSIFGKIRYMSSDSTRKKLKLTQYLSRNRSE